MEPNQQKKPIKQNITRDIKIKNKLTGTIGVGGGGNGGKKCCQVTCIKDTWKKPKRCRIEGGNSGLVGWGKVIAGKWRQLYLSNNKK